MIGGYGMKLKIEDFRERANVDLSEVEDRLLNTALTGFTLNDYIAARTERDFYARLVAEFEHTQKNQPDVQFIDVIDFYCQPSSHLNPLSRSTSTMANLVEDLIQSYKVQVTMWVKRLRETQAEREAESQAEGK